MTKEEAIQRADALVYNQYTRQEKMEWLGRADAMVQRAIFDTHEGEPEEVPEPYDSLYVHWLEAQVHYHNGDYDRYNGAILLFNSELAAYAAEHNKRNPPKSRARRFIF